MAIFECKAEVAPGAVEPLEEILALQEEPRRLILEDKPSGRAWLAGYFETTDAAQTAWRSFVEAVDPEWIAGEPELRALAEADWRDSYKAHFKAWKCGRLNWVPVWERAAFRLPAGEEVLWLDPGLAFGTGNHETTRLCVERLVAFSEAPNSRLQVPREQWRVIDAGCGSGILALSAAKLGLGEVTGFDNDPEAGRVSEENAALNGLAGGVKFAVGDLVTGLAGRRAELVLANIQADVLMRFARDLVGAVAPNGVIILSGILARELAEVRTVFAASAPGWRSDTRILGEWADLVLTRSS